MSTETNPTASALDIASGHVHPQTAAWDRWNHRHGVLACFLLAVSPLSSIDAWDTGEILAGPEPTFYMESE